MKIKEEKILLSKEQDELKTIFTQMKIEEVELKDQLRQYLTDFSEKTKF